MIYFRYFPPAMRMAAQAAVILRDKRKRSPHSDIQRSDFKEQFKIYKPKKSFGKGFIKTI